MDLSSLVEHVKMELGGGILHLELKDEQIEKIINQSLFELQRYIDTTKLVTVPYADCIDLNGFKHSAIISVYRTEGYTGDTSSGADAGVVDPMYAQTWMIFSNGGTMYNLNDYVLNYLSYNTLLQMRNTTTTDLAFREDKEANKLYINKAFDRPTNITIEYIPVIEKVEDVTSDYWIDILKRLSVAHTKVILGRIRSRFKTSSTLWEQDGDTILTEGVEELKEIREMLATNNNLCLPID